MPRLSFRNTLLCILFVVGNLLLYGNLRLTVNVKLAYGEEVGDGDGPDRYDDENDDGMTTTERPSASSSGMTNSNSKRNSHPYFVNFSGNPQGHNTTVDGKFIPGGTFYNGKLFLLGARITTAYDDQESVAVTLFGIPKGVFREKSRCETAPLTNLTTYEKIVENLSVYVQLECQEGDTCHNGTNDDNLIKMELIPTDKTTTTDPNQIKMSIIWHGKLSPQLISKADIGHQASLPGTKAIRVSFLLHDKRSGNPDNKLIQVTQVDIPITTGVVGNAGPHVMSSDGTRTSPSLVASPKIGAALCVTAYGDKVLRYLPEYIEHHRNVGFEQIILGMGVPIGSEDVETYRHALKDYIDDGTLVLASYALKDIKCKQSLHRIHFYNSCLYHAKGIAEYVGVWDIDEYWVPPPQLPNSAKSNRKHPAMLESDAIWKESNYSSFPSIMDAMALVQEHQQQHGCGSDWCFQTFPSHQAFRKREQGPDDKTSMVDRSRLVSRDYLKRNSEEMFTYRKSISRTKWINAGGIHVPGTCRAPGASNFFLKMALQKHLYTKITTTSSECRNLFSGEFGRLHHFMSLNAERGERHYRSSFPDGEYSSILGAAVAKQLERRAGLQQ